MKYCPDLHDYVRIHSHSSEKEDSKQGKGSTQTYDNGNAKFEKMVEKIKGFSRDFSGCENTAGLRGIRDNPVIPWK